MNIQVSDASSAQSYLELSRLFRYGASFAAHNGQLGSPGSDLHIKGLDSTLCRANYSGINDLIIAYRAIQYVLFE